MRRFDRWRDGERSRYLVEGAVAEAEELGPEVEPEVEVEVEEHEPDEGRGDGHVQQRREHR